MYLRFVVAKLFLRDSKCIDFTRTDQALSVGHEKVDGSIDSSWVPGNSASKVEDRREVRSGMPVQISTHGVGVHTAEDVVDVGERFG